MEPTTQLTLIQILALAAGPILAIGSLAYLSWRTSKLTVDGGQVDEVAPVAETLQPAAASEAVAEEVRSAYRFELGDFALRQGVVTGFAEATQSPIENDDLSVLVVRGGQVISASPLTLQPKSTAGEVPVLGIQFRKKAVTTRDVIAAATAPAGPARRRPGTKTPGTK